MNYLPYKSHASLLILSSACHSMLSLGNLCLVPALGIFGIEGLPGGSCVAGALSWSAFLRFVQSMQRFVPKALFKMAAPFDILSVLLGRNGYGRNGYWPK